MVPNEVELLLDNQRKCFNDAIDRLDRRLTDYVKSNEKQIGELVASLEFSQAELRDVRKQLDSEATSKLSTTEHITQLKQDNSKLQRELSEATRRLDYQDDQGRRPNLRLCGVEEQPNENGEQSHHKVARIIREKLNLTPEIERAYRIGKTTAKQPYRDILVRFCRTADRDTVFRTRSAMKGTNIFINEDLCLGTIEARRLQMTDYHDARRRGKYVFFNYRTLVIRDPRPSLSRTSRHQGDPTPFPPGPHPAPLPTPHPGPQTPSRGSIQPAPMPNRADLTTSPRPTTMFTQEFPILGDRLTRDGEGASGGHGRDSEADEGSTRGSDADTAQPTPSATSKMSLRSRNC